MTAAMMPTGRLGYLPALDGLRGIAILMVLAQHATLPFMARSGSVGVTLFFVLSGFLITSLLLEEQERAGRIDLWAFYQRRARRLLPALFVFLAVMALVGVHVETIVPAVLYYANWAALSDGSMYPIAHTWSLAIEEQFYIAWPLALIGLLRIAPRMVGPVLVAGIGAAMALRAVAWMATGDVEWTFFATQHRADALLAGCLLALVLIKRSWIPSWPVVVVAVSGVAIASVIPSFGFLAVVGLTLATGGSVVLVAAAAGTSPRLLTWRPLVYVGVISYGLYLWHGPLLRVARDANAAPVLIAGAVLLAFLLAAVSRRFIEAPFLHPRKSASETARDAEDRAFIRSTPPASAVPLLPPHLAGTRPRPRAG